jgi:glycosyltransferase involved in cell wall biosynthesis
MKILVLSHEYPPIGGGGGRVVQELSQGLANRGYQIHLLTAHYADQPKMEQSENLVIKRLPSWRTQPFRADLKAMGAFVIKSFFRGLKVIRKFQPDLIHAHFAVPAGVSAFLLSKATGVPYILTAHGGDVPGGAPEKTAHWFRFILPFSKLVWSNAAAIAAVSEQTRDLALEHYQAEIRVIYNGINTQEMKPQELGVHTPPSILFIGRFSPEKNATAVPRILAELKHLPWHCAMLGDGTEMNQVRNLIDKNNLTDRIQLIGWVDSDSVKEHLAKSDVLLMPSLREGMPMAALQALSMGLALLLPDKGSCPDLIGNNGFLIEPGNLQAYTDSLEKLLTDKDLLAKFKINSRQLSEKFDIHLTVDAYDKLIGDTIRGRSR